MEQRGRRGGWLGAIRVVLAFAMVGDLVYLATIPQNHTFYVGMAPLSGFKDPYGHDLPKDANLTIGFTEIGQRDYTTGEHLLYLAGHGLTLAVVTFPMMWLAMRLVGRAIDERHPGGQRHGLDGRVELDADQPPAATPRVLDSR